MKKDPIVTTSPGHHVTSITKNTKFFIWIFLLATWCLGVLVTSGYAKEITILYTGDTHAMLYPCICPKEADGGIARRLTLLKQLKKKYPQALILDSGGYFAGGLLDEYTQNTDLDMERTRINLKAMELAHYDAAGVGSDELNFGEKFFLENIGSSPIAHLSCNLKSEKVLPYMIKEVSGVKIGIIGVTTIHARQKQEKFQVFEPKSKLDEAIAAAKSAGANIIVVLSRLNENEELNIINETPEIDILISGHSRPNSEPAYKAGQILVLKPSWQGRRIGKLVFDIKNNKVVNYKAEELRLSDKVADDPQIKTILPRCFSDNNCKKEGLIGICQNPGTLGSACMFSEAQKINLTVITARSCAICNYDNVVKSLKKIFPGLTVNILYYPETEKAVRLVKDFNVSGLPAYFLGREVEKETRFNDMRAVTELKGDLYYLKPQHFGYTYLIDRKRIKDRMDVFISLYDKDKDPAALLEVLRPLKSEVHFIVMEKDGGFDALKGALEVEEDLRSVCVKKYCPETFWDYIICRAKDIDSSWWENCLGKCDSAKIKACAQGQEGKDLLRQNSSLAKELQIMLGPACLSENQEISGCSAAKKNNK
jgi:hypothetical protein